MNKSRRGIASEPGQQSTGSAKVRSNLARDPGEGDPLTGVFTETWRRAVVAEINWVTSGGPRGIPVVPVVHRGRPTVALPYSQLASATELAGATAVFTVTDLDSGSRTAVAARGPVEVVEDPEGDIFISEEVLIQEIIKHPPTKLRSDSLVARRENPWWVPRMIVTLTAIEEELPIAGRTRASDALLVTGEPDAPQVNTVTAPDWDVTAGGRIEVFGRDGTDLLGDGEPAVAWSHQFTPDFERWDRWTRLGILSGTTLQVVEATGRPVERVPPLRLLERFSAHRAAARECRRGLAAAGHHG